MDSLKTLFEISITLSMVLEACLFVGTVVKLLVEL